MRELFLSGNWTNGSAPPLPRRASATPKKKVSCFFDLAGVKFFLKVERIFFFGVLPSKSSASVAEQCGLGFAKTIFWGKDFAKHSANLF
ncbi:MAG: hypothetical protein A3I08_00975 [Candidatus Andersenbacteria bacterium RIFCSPLOWO2_02_FULL_46_11]|nr:MAG: hypothetical protein A3I08_00975 [Candidatus Andersenbacteria bacterium RIFCSPLOWO2_02_FULL_46_11]